MTTVDVLIVAKESILIEKFKKNVKSHFFCPILYIYVCICDVVVVVVVVIAVLVVGYLIS